MAASSATCDQQTCFSWFAENWHPQQAEGEPAATVADYLSCAMPPSGVVPVAPTPFDERDKMDYAGQKRIQDLLVDADIDGNASPGYFPPHGAS
jgi:hypothetical protein